MSYVDVTAGPRVLGIYDDEQWHGYKLAKEHRASYNLYMRKISCEIADNPVTADNPKTVIRYEIGLLSTVNLNLNSGLRLDISSEYKAYDDVLLDGYARANTILETFSDVRLENNDIRRAKFNEYKKIIYELDQFVSTNSKPDMYDCLLKY